jgi:hypothetical protein
VAVVTGPGAVAEAVVVDNAQHLLIVHPDHLVAGTLAADALSCMRRSVLNERLKGASDASPALVFGSLVSLASTQILPCRGCPSPLTHAAWA